MPQAGHSFAHLFWEMERRVMQTIDKEKNKEFYEECGGGNNLTLSGVKNLTLVRRQRSVRRCAEVREYEKMTGHRRTSRTVCHRLITPLPVICEKKGGT